MREYEPHRTSNTSPDCDIHAENRSLLLMPRLSSLFSASTTSAKMQSRLWATQRSELQ